MGEGIHRGQGLPTPPHFGGFAKRPWTTMEEFGDPLGLRAGQFGREAMWAFGFGLERGQPS